MLHQGAPPSLHAPTPTILQQESVGLLLVRHSHTHTACVFVTGGCDGSLWTLSLLWMICVLFKVQLWGSHVTLTVLCGSKNVPPLCFIIIII